jgi:hypothetical protein
VGGCPKCPKLGVGHFGHIRFKIFLIFDFDGHLVDRRECLIDVKIFGTLYSALTLVFVNMQCGLQFASEAFGIHRLLSAKFKHNLLQILR